MNFSATPERLIIIVFLALATGWALGQWWRSREIRRNKYKIKRAAQEILQDAKRKGKATVVDAEILAKEILSEERKQFDRESSRIREEFATREGSLDRRTESLARAESEASQARIRLDELHQGLLEREKKISASEERVKERLHELAAIDPEGARELVLTEARTKVQQRIDREVGEILQKSRSDAESVAREAVIGVVERISREIISERSTCMVEVPTEEMKGRIIGRDGRNVRAFEAITGVDVLLDEVPDHVVLSSHSPLRREVARKTLTKLIEDGRIQPSRISEFFKQAETEVYSDCLNHGRSAEREAGINGLPEEIVLVLGRLRFRSSYSQNVLLHSIETAHIAGLIAAELRFSTEDQNNLRRAALLHDIGKALNEEHQGPHALVGAEFLKKHGENPRVVNAVAAHHGEVGDESVYAPLIRAADILSGARPGARREDLEAYIKRLEAMETVARSFAGVTNAYAIQAGRELHVVVSSERLSDAQTEILAGDVASRIQREIKFPGQVKVIAIREKRASSIASQIPQ